MMNIDHSSSRAICRSLCGLMLLLGAFTRPISMASDVLPAVNNRLALPLHRDDTTTLLRWNQTEGDSAQTSLIGPAAGLTEPMLQIVPKQSAVTLESEPIPIHELSPYRLRVSVLLVDGPRSGSIHLVWLDRDRKPTGTDWAGVAAFVRSQWVDYHIEAIAPERSQYVQVVIQPHIAAQWRLKDFQLKRLPPAGARLALDLLSDQAAAPSGEAGSLKLRMENRGDVPLENLRVAIDLPQGLRAQTSSTLAIRRLSYAESATATWLLQGSPLKKTDLIQCRVDASAGGRPLRFSQSTKPFVSRPNEVPTPTAQLPEPRLPRMNVQLGCYYFPVMLDWNRRQQNLSGSGVQATGTMRPRLGFYNEALPEVADWHIYWAVEHGVSFFVFDWYFNKGMDYLNDALEKGFLQSRFRDKMKFCIDWCNEGHCSEFKRVDFGDSALRQFMTVLCQRYFTQRNYLRVEGKPVVLIHVPTEVASDQGGWKGCHDALEKMRAIARSYGHPGVYFVAVQNNFPFLLDYQRGGFDCVTSYAYGFRDQHIDGQRTLDYEALLPRHQECFEIGRREAHARGLDFIPTAWVGWDDTARSGAQAVRTRGATPAAFRRMLEMLPATVEKRTRLALFESWNEWGEGGQAEPGEPYGFGRLSAVRDVLSDRPGPYRIATPAHEDVARFASNLTVDDVNDIYFMRYAHNQGLDKQLDLEFESPNALSLRPIQGLTDFKTDQGLFCITAISNSPLLETPFVDLSTERVRAVQIRMKVSAGTTAQLLWRMRDQKEWRPECARSFPVQADNQFHDYWLDFSQTPGWKGTLRQVRLLPTDRPARIAIDSFRTMPDPQRVHLN